MRCVNAVTLLLAVAQCTAGKLRSELNFFPSEEAVQTSLKENEIFAELHLDGEALDTARANEQWTGRAFFFVAKSDAKEPRRSISGNQDTEQFFGVDVQNWNFEEDGPIQFPVDTLGYPRESVQDIEDGDYFVQAVFQPYELYQRDVPVWMPMITANKLEGGRFAWHPGVWYSKVQKMRWSQDGAVKLKLEHVQPEEPEVDSKNDTKYIKHISVRSELLSKFWGKPIDIEACVLLPYGFDEHPETRYPLMLYHGHYHADFATPGFFSETPADPSLTGYDLVTAQYAYDFYLNWTRPDGGPFYKNRAIIVTLKHPTPLYDDSYAVNSENMGPYGDAIMHEVIPVIEKRFRAIGEGWARATYGGSTGGWESLAVQVMYPDDFNGCYTSCPDPISFEMYTTVNIYKDKNAYWLDSKWKRTEVPAQRGQASNWIYPGYWEPNGIVEATQREVNLMELVMGTNGRSGGQWDVWQNVFGPRNKKTGFVEPIWDKRTGEINPDVASFWKENYDLTHILKRDWNKIGHKLQGKMHVYVGTMDSFYLNNAVYKFEETLQTLDNPKPDVTIVYGSHDGRGYAHCYGGQAAGVPNSVARLTINAFVLPQALDRIVKTAPHGADLSWRY